MVVSISGRFTPLRMFLSRRESVQFALYLRNEGSEEKRLTVKVMLSPHLAFTKGGFKNSELIRIDSIKPGEEKTLYFELHPKISTRPGEESVKVRVQEHYANFQYTKKQYNAGFSLKIEE